jgi:hypothetical protein
VRGGVLRVEGIGVADVASEHRAGIGRDLLGDLERRLVDRLEILFAADDAQLLAVGVVGAGLDDVGAGMDEVAMELDERLGMLDHDLGHEGAGLQIAAALELEDIAFRADDGAVGEAFEQVLGHGRSSKGKSMPAIFASAPPGARVRAT